ncbi:MAG TPA: DNA primase [Clostridiaceae bacterium]|nr:DNA primase [Clostridiaceae bacterium]
MSGFIPQEIINQIIEQTDIVPIVEQYVKLSKKSSVNYFGLCPFHSETKPSFSVSPGKQIFYCFSCQRGGNVIKFIQDIENVSFPDAVRILAEKANIEIPTDDRKIYEHNQTERKIQQNLHLEAARFYYNSLNKSSNRHVKRYMTERGFSGKTLIAFGIGYADSEWDSLVIHLRNAGFNDEQILASGIIRKSSRNNLIDLFRDRVMIPIFPSHGRYIIGFGGRAVNDADEPKYINSPENILYHKGENLFALNLVRKLRPLPESLILTEGYMDVMALYQSGFHNTIASLGTALTENQARLIDRYAKKLILAYDSDQAGINAALRAIEILEKFNVEIYVLDLGDAKDPDNYIKKYGKARFQALLNEAPSALDFQIKIARIKSTDHNGYLNLNQYTAEVAELLAKLDSAVMIELYAKRLSEEINVASSTIIYDVNRIKQSNTKANSEQVEQKFSQNLSEYGSKSIVSREYKQVVQIDQKKYVRDQWLILAILASSPELFDLIKDRFKPDLFSNRALKTLADKIIQAAQKNQLSVQNLVFWTDDLSHDLENINYTKQLMPVLMALEAEDIRSDQELLFDVLQKLEQYAMQVRQAEILEAVKDKHISSEQRRILIEELSVINKNINYPKRNT